MCAVRCASARAPRTTEVTAGSATGGIAVTTATTTAPTTAATTAVMTVAKTAATTAQYAPPRVLLGTVEQL